MTVREPPPTTGPGNRLRDKVALVVGAGCLSPKEMGIGKACALAYAREGASVFAVDVDDEALAETAKEIRAGSGRVATHRADVGVGREVEDMVGSCLREFGRVDVVLYNVAVGDVGAPPDLSEESWERTFRINCTGLFLTCKHVLPGMVERRSGNVIGISSIAGIRYAGYPHFAYGASKAALIQFIRYVALHYAPAGLRANTIVPGLIDTPRVMRLSAAYGPDDRAAVMRRRSSQVPTGRSGQPVDVAEAAIFLASDASNYVTGTELVVDGGITAGYGTMP